MHKQSNKSRLISAGICSPLTSELNGFLNICSGGLYLYIYNVRLKFLADMLDTECGRTKYSHLKSLKAARLTSSAVSLRAKFHQHDTVTTCFKNKKRGFLITLANSI